MKKTYQKPKLKVVRIQHASIICASETATVSTVSSTGIFEEQISAGNGPARSRGSNVWGDSEDDE